MGGVMEGLTPVCHFFAGNCFSSEKISNGKDLLQSGAPLPKDGTQNRGRRVKPQKVELQKFRFLAYRSSWTHPFQYGNLFMI